jgi:hypothetical protein
MTVKKSHKSNKSPINKWHSSRIPEGKQLLIGVDHGYPVVIPIESFAPPQRSGGWGPYAETFSVLMQKLLEL